MANRGTRGNFMVGSLTIGQSTISETELARNDGVTAGTVTASKTVVVDSNKDIGDFRNLDAVNLDAGASGTAGTVDVFPATAAKGKLAITCTNQAGDTTVTLNAAEMAGARTITIPDPGASASIVMTEGAQTVNGVKTFGSVPVTPAGGITIGATTVTGAMAALLLTGVGAYKVARGESVLDGSNPTTIASGLTSIIAVVLTLKGSVAPGVGTCLLTTVISGTDFNVYAWKPTGAGDCTLIASTGTESFYWVAVGT